MRFLIHHFVLTQISIALGVVLFWDLKFVTKDPTLNPGTNPAVNRTFRIIGTLTMATFLVWGYCVPSIFYFPNNIGVVGDMYCYMNAIMSWKNTVINFHMAFPWVAEKFLLVCRAVGLLSPADPFYYEKAVQLAAWPTKILMVCALGAAFCHFYKSTASFSKAFLAFLTLATSYGCWIWGLQPNALGMGVAVQMMIFIITLYWTQKRSLWLLLWLAILTGSCVFIHISLWGFCVGMYAALMLIVILSGGSKKRRLLEAVVFNLAVAIMARAFLSIELHLNSANNLTELFNSLTGGDPFLAHTKTLRSLAMTLKDNFVMGVMNVTNFWDPQNLREKIPVALQLSSLVGLAISLAISFKETVRHVNKSQLLVYGAASLSVFTAFTFTYPATHYYVVATVPNLFLFLALILTDIQKLQETIRRKWLLTLFVIASFAHSGFSSQNVFRGKNINENNYYKESVLVLNRLGSSSRAHVFKRFDFTDYINQAVGSYYHSKFANVIWDPDEKHWGNPTKFLDKLESLHASNSQIYVDASAIELLKRSPGRYHLTPVADNLWQIDFKG